MIKQMIRKILAPIQMILDKIKRKKNQHKMMSFTLKINQNYKSFPAASKK